MLKTATLARMDSSSKKIQLQYQGFFNTPLLWKQHRVSNLEQLELPLIPCHQLTDIPYPNNRLGKRVEQFVIASLKQYKDIRIIAQNLQIQNQKITVGELDCILCIKSQTIHLEIVYKFYLYDATVGTTELEHWIGPNRNDNLLKKLSKLKNKQLPLLFNKYAEGHLNYLGLKPEMLMQRVCFKAQLFVPYNSNIHFDLLNKDCLQGFYVHFLDVAQFSGCKFYIPEKMDWLLSVNTQVDWLSYGDFCEKVLGKSQEKRAALYWIKFPNGNMQKFFVVYWKSV